MSTISAPYTPTAKAWRLNGAAFLMRWIHVNRDSEGVETNQPAPTSIAFEITNPAKPGFLVEIAADSDFVTISGNTIELEAETPAALGLTLKTDPFWPVAYKVRLYTISGDAQTRHSDVDLYVVDTLPAYVNEEGTSGAESFKIVYTEEGAEEGVTAEVRQQLENQIAGMPTGTVSATIESMTEEEKPTGIRLFYVNDGETSEEGVLPPGLWCRTPTNLLFIPTEDYTNLLP